MIPGLVAVGQALGFHESVGIVIIGWGACSLSGFCIPHGRLKNAMSLYASSQSFTNSDIVLFTNIKQVCMSVAS